jgi:hypothetical protein
MERQLIDAMDEAVYPYLKKYTREDGTLIYRDDFRSRDGADDFYESFYNWPLFYLLGGGDHLLDLAHREWEAITRQLTAYGNINKEYERGYDQFHQAESYIYFYLLCLADPTNPKLEERARRFAGFFLNEDPEAPNYDPVHKVICGPHSGSGGPLPAMGVSDPSYGYSPGMARYGLPYEDVPGVTHCEDLKDPGLARRMGRAMQERMGRGDVVANLGVTSLVTNAYLLTGDAKYRRWVLEYVDAWVDRARENGGLLPDNVGLSGKIGEYIGGKWYGGLYGWTWPHGFYNIGMAAIVAAANAFLLTRDPRYLDLPRMQIDRILSLGAVRDVGELQMSLQEHWIGIWRALGAERRAFVVPYRYGDSGWFDYQPMSMVYPTAVWALSTDPQDWERLERIRQACTYDWSMVSSFRNKEDCGHEEPWLRYLAGANHRYPEAILSAGYEQVCRRLELIRRDQADLTKVSIHHWQQLNPVVTEALIQLTLGAPQIIYNGGLLFAPLRYYDLGRHRPGLPQDVAALVQHVEARRVALRLANLNPLASRDMLIQAGSFAEHRFAAARFSTRASDYPGKNAAYSTPELRTEATELPIGDKVVHIHLPPSTEIALELEMERFVNQASYALPW